MIFQWIYRLWSYPWSGFTNRRRRRLLDNHDDSASTTCLPIDQDNDYCCQKPSLPSSCGRTAGQDDDDDRHCPAPSFAKEESHISHQRSRHQQQDKSPFQNTRHHQPIHNERRRVQPKVGFTKRPTPTTQHTLYSRQQQHKHASVMLRRRPRASLSIKHPPAQEEKTNNKNTTYHDYNDDNDPHAIIRRFVPPHARMFATALAEIQQGRQKRGHWSWYFMPTPPHIMDGSEVGSDTNRRYALRSLEEGAEYLLLPTTQGVNLRDNYIALMTAIRQVLADGDHPRLTVTQLIGSDDVPKLFSSLAFFEHVGTCIDDDAIVSVCQQTARQCHQQSFSNDPSWELARPATCFRDTTKPTHDVDSSQDEQKQEEQRFDHHEEEFLMDYSDMSEDDMDEKELCPIVSAYDATTNHTLHYSSKRRKME